jgi:hypothetical protein
MVIDDILKEIGFTVGVYANGSVAKYDRRYIYKCYMFVAHHSDDHYSAFKLKDTDYTIMDLFSDIVNDDRGETILFNDKDRNYAEEFLKEEFKHILRKGKIKKLMNL